MKRILTLVLPLLLLLSGCAPAEEAPFSLISDVTVGASGSFVSCPVLTGGDAAVCERVNARIRETAKIDSYLSLLSGLSAGSTGLKVTFDTNYEEGLPCPDVLSLLIKAEGKMLKGRPGAIYYTVTFDLETGNELRFGDLCTDEAAARAQIDLLAEDVITPQISDYMAASLITPVPCDRFFLDGRGRIVFVYDAQDFSFVSGDPGAAALQLTDIPEGMDLSDSGPCARALVPGKEDPALRLLGQDLDEALTALRAPFDSEWFPGGEAWQTEAALLRGTDLVSTDGRTVDKVLILELVPQGTALTPGDAPEGAVTRPLTPDEQDLADTDEARAVCYEKAGILYTCYFDLNDTFLFVLCERAVQID